MANYQLGPVIGKIGGGADVQKTPLNIVADSTNTNRVTIHTVHVPEGETWLVVLSGDINAVSSSSAPELSIGEVSIGTRLKSGRHSIASEVTGTTEITFKRNFSQGADRFDGHVYTVPMPA